MYGVTADQNNHSSLSAFDMKKINLGYGMTIEDNKFIYRYNNGNNHKTSGGNGEIFFKINKNILDPTSMG